MSPHRDYKSRASEQIDEGRLWRAKEILRGNIATRGFDLELYEEYGRLLRELGEELEAGKYLFLSGANNEEYLPAIRLCLARTGTSAELLRSTFPAAARDLRLEYYPSNVRDELEKRGYKGGHRHPADPRQPFQITPRARFMLGGCILVAVSAAVCAVVGFVTMMGWLVNMLTTL